MRKHLILGVLTLSLSLSASALPSNITIVRPSEKTQNSTTTVKAEPPQILKDEVPEAVIEGTNEAQAIADEKLKQAQEQDKMLQQNNETASSPPAKQVKKIKLEQVKYDVFTTDIGLWNKTTLEQLEKKGQENLEKSYKAFLDKK